MASSLFGTQAFRQGACHAKAVAGGGHDAACIARTFAAGVKAGLGLEHDDVSGLPVGGWGIVGQLRLHVLAAHDADGA